MVYTRSKSASKRRIVKKSYQHQGNSLSRNATIKKLLYLIVASNLALRFLKEIKLTIITTEHLFNILVMIVWIMFYPTSNHLRWMHSFKLHFLKHGNLFMQLQKTCGRFFARHIIFMPIKTRTDVLTRNQNLVALLLRFILDQN